MSDHNQQPQNNEEINPDLLDSPEEISKIDENNVLGSIEALPDQIRQGWEHSNQVKFAQSTPINNVVVAGMGGSGLGPDVAKHLFKDELKVPLEVYNSYSLPGYVDQHSLVILASYSGNTEEILSCAQQALDKEAQIMAITSGGELKKIADKNDIPAYIIKPEHNPSNQPRMAIGYAIAGIMGLLNSAGVIEVDQASIDQTAKTVLTTAHQCRVELEAETNPAKTLAFICTDRRPILVGAEFLSGAVHVAANQFNENAKTFADYKLLPEINHHLMEGLKQPRTNRLDTLFLFFNSKLYHIRNQKRVTLTQEAVEKQHIQTLAINLDAETKLEQVFELITMMSYANFYLSILYRIDPSLIPTVDWFKQELNKGS